MPPSHGEMFSEGFFAAESCFSRNATLPTSGIYALDLYPARSDCDNLDQPWKQGGFGEQTRLLVDQRVMQHANRDGFRDLAYGVWQACRVCRWVIFSSRDIFCDDRIDEQEMFLSKMMLIERNLLSPCV
ncbi:unnamed protein product [Toxocara canis]|uniref:HET domain-containing protein n=1 Tax=Toxocara canis TaxID=6265 RepID=A0A183UXJ2_TOXCA|nr:unnamed protein product [Toxocara canis]